MADEASIDNTLLISLVEQRPVLWDKTMDLYKNRVASREAWKEIMMVLNPNLETKEEKIRQDYVKLIIQKWTHIRDSYNRSNKKIEDRKRLGKGVKSVKPYVYSKNLRFLQKVYPKETMSNYSESSTQSENQENNSGTNERSEITMRSLQTNEMVTINPVSTKRPMNNDNNPLDLKMVKYMDSNYEPQTINRNLSFFHGILPSLDNFDEDEVLEFQMGVLQLLKKIRNCHQNRNSFDVNYGGPSVQRSTQEYQSTNNNSVATNSSNAIRNSQQRPDSVDSYCSNDTDIDHKDF